MAVPTATVAVEKTQFNYDGHYTYQIPASLRAVALPGARVRVSFGRGNAVREGFILDTGELPDDPQRQLKDLLSVAEEYPLVTDEMLGLAAWMRERTFSSTFSCLKAMVPRGVGLVGDAAMTMARLAVSREEFPPKLTGKQSAVLDLLEDAGSAERAEVCQLAGVTTAVLDNLVKKGLVETYRQPVYRTPYRERGGAGLRESLQLSPAQEEAYLQLSGYLRRENAETALLFGVTGSGKTHVFLKLMDETLELGKSVLVLLPEISLTAQALEIYHKRYGSLVAVFHSALSMGERADEFKRVREGKARIVVGTRSAVFAPFEDLGLIIMDEEQEHTYKAENAPRYHARDVARFRSAYHKALLVLASATPSVESYSHAVSGSYHLCEIEERYGAAVLPRVMTVDMKRQENRAAFSRAVSGELYDRLRNNMESGHQSILLINRRGYHTFIACNSCGYVITCPNCSISMTYHSKGDTLVCHYCGYRTPLVRTCPECHEDSVRYSGSGTQRIEDELAQNLPEARILRMDADTTTARYSHEKKLGEFARGEYDILLGTQMVAKGLNFPNVTLVGVVNADQALYNENYTASERAFSLLTQVVGRSGRGSAEGIALVQTINPENPVIELAARQDYKSFYAQEIALRRNLIYPPFCDLYVIAFLDAQELKAANAAASFFQALTALNDQQYHEKLILLGPSPAKIAKISNQYRYKIVMKCKNSQSLREMLRRLLIEHSKKKEYHSVTAYVDLNPEDIA